MCLTNLFKRKPVINQPHNVQEVPEPDPTPTPAPPVGRLRVVNHPGDLIHRRAKDLDRTAPLVLQAVDKNELDRYAGNYAVLTVQEDYPDDPVGPLTAMWFLLGVHAGSVLVADARGEPLQLTWEPGEILSAEVVRHLAPLPL